MSKQGEHGIAWTDVTWNPVRGCSRVSEGCRNCYAERMATRFSGPGQPYEGLVTVPAGGRHGESGRARTGIRGKWNGVVRLIPERLADPLHWRRPRKVFVNSMSDLFHESLSNEQIAAVFGVMAAAPQHTFQVLTKRANRMLAWFQTVGILDLVEEFKHIALAGRIVEYFAPERTVDLKQWPGYAVTSKGRVLSTKRGTEHEMAVMCGEHGHGRVMLYRDGETDRPLVHRLVLEAFDREPKPGEQGRHISGDATNNALWNLCWGTQSENWDDSRRHGTRRRYSKLSAEQVDEVRRLGEAGVSGADLGRNFGISDTQARNIVNGKQWVPEHKLEWPLASVWLGASVEDQATADERIPLLLKTPATVRWVSYEPALGPVDFSRWLIRECLDCLGSGEGEGAACEECGGSGTRPRVQWLVCGGESGPGARPFDVAWARSLIEQCKATGARAFIKQVGSFAVDSQWRTGTYAPDDKRTKAASAALEQREGDTPPNLLLLGKKGGDPATWPTDLSVREFPR